MHTVRSGSPSPSGRPLVLLPGVGADTGTWEPVLPGLEAAREVVRLDLPGFGRTPLPTGPYTLAAVADALEAHLRAEGLEGADLVGSSMGARLALEMARRGNAGGVVALDPGGFWRGGERAYVRASLGGSVALLRTMRPMLPAIVGNAAGRTALLMQLSARPWALDGALVAGELQAMAGTTTIDALIHDLTSGPEQRGTHSAHPVVIGWGRQDRLLFPAQAARAVAAFPGARLHWFDRSGHFPAWDEPEATAAMIRGALG